VKSIAVLGAAAVTVAMLTACTTGGQAQGMASGLHRSEMPRYYVVIVSSSGTTVVAQHEAVVRDSATGRVIGSRAVLAPDVPVGTYVTAAADDRLFIIGALEKDPGSAAYSYRFFWLRLGPGGTPGPLTAIPGIAIPASRGAVQGIALSPDGTKLAVSVETSPTRTVDTVIATGQIDVIDLMTGKTRAWVSQTTGYYPGPPSWADGSTMLAFAWLHEFSIVEPQLSGSAAAVAELDTAASGNSLPGSPMPILVNAIRSAVFASASRFAVVSACQDHPTQGGRGTVTVRIDDVAGRQVTALRTQTASYTGPDGEATAEANCDVLAVDPTGQHALVRGFGFGRIDNGTFTPLPGIPPDAVLASAAW
jgi:hypothetical protein